MIIGFSYQLNFEITCYDPKTFFWSILESKFQIWALRATSQFRTEYNTTNLQHKCMKTKNKGTLFWTNTFQIRIIPVLYSKQKEIKSVYKQTSDNNEI